jgi:hypothetical protein
MQSIGNRCRPARFAEIFPLETKVLPMPKQQPEHDLHVGPHAAAITTCVRERQ